MDTFSLQNFDIQRFGGTTTEDRWTTLTELDETHYTEVNAAQAASGATVFWGFVPSGTSYTNGANITYRDDLRNISTTGLAYVFAKSDVKLKITPANTLISLNSQGTNMAIVGASVDHGVVDTATLITVGLNYGKTVDDLFVEGDNKTTLKIMIDDTVYNVYFDGSVGTLPKFGLMKKADKEALATAQNTLNTHETRIGTLEIDMSTAIVGGEMTANGFVLKNKIGADVATIQSVGLDAETAAATYATKEEMRQYVRQVITSSTGVTFINGSGTTIAEIPLMQ